jgi:transposase-like protein
MNKQLSPETRARIVQLSAAHPDLTYQIIATRMGVSKATVRSVIREVGTKHQSSALDQKPVHAEKGNK